MWIILCAILLLCVLVLINKKREGFTSLHILTIYNILMDKTTDGAEKMKLLKDPSLIINDVPITNIINSEKLSNEEKILKIKLYIDSLIDKRNAKPEHVNNTRIIDYDTFFNVIKILQNPDFDQDNEKVLEIKKLGLIDDQFDAVLNSKETDSLKIINVENPTKATLHSLINEIIFPS